MSVKGDDDRGLQIFIMNNESDVGFPHIRLQIGKERGRTKVKGAKLQMLFDVVQGVKREIFPNQLFPSLKPQGQFLGLEVERNPTSARRSRFWNL
ncbi:hypothetical protein L6452_35992 [Arctium lappa]|uniref:Uncharacterized protein n=1 Tax=Arctium lappa TaxID=4217 RepID=A0ACB8Y787_ARCLA|nr:hypothetical protein L6452_35992 [Arctium lappa]